MLHSAVWWATFDLCHVVACLRRCSSMANCLLVPLFWLHLSTVCLYIALRWVFFLSLFSPTPTFFPFFLPTSRMCHSFLYYLLSIFNREHRMILQLWKPHYLIAVPRLFETIHKGVVGNLRQQSQASQFKCRLISTLTACTQLYLRFLKTLCNLLVRAKKPSAMERVRLYYAYICMNYHGHLTNHLKTWKLHYILLSYGNILMFSS